MIDPNITSFFNEVYDSTHKTVLLYLTGKCQSLSDVNDICQDVYFEFYKILVEKGSGYIRNPGGLLRRLARRKLHQYYHMKEQRAKVQVISLDASEEDPSYIGQEQAVLEAPGTSEDEILVEEIRQYLRQKPDDIQKIFYLYFELEQTIPQIAKKLSMKESTVKSKLYRTRDELRKCYQKEDADEQRR